MPYLGESITIGSVTATAFVTATDEKLAFELTGYVDECDWFAVLNVADWTADVPQVKDQFTLRGSTVTIRGVKTDESSYSLALKKTSV